jgi:hypothetical protein
MLVWSLLGERYAGHLRFAGLCSEPANRSATELLFPCNQRNQWFGRGRMQLDTDGNSDFQAAICSA